MPLPGDIHVITVTGTYQDALGNLLAGSVTFVLSQPLTDSTGHVSVAAGQYVAPVVNGSFSITLPCTDNATLNPTSFAYTVIEQVGGVVRSNLFQLPHTLGATVDISTLIPVNTPQPYSTIYGVLANSQTWTGKNVFSGEVNVLDPVNPLDPVNLEYFNAHGGAAVTSVNGHIGAVVLGSSDVGAIPTTAAGAANGVATLDSGSHLTVAQLPPSAIQTVRQAYVTSGAITFGADAAWTLYTAVELDIPATVNDWVELSIGGMWQPAGGDFIDWAVVVGTSAVRYASSGSGTPGLEGDPAFYPGAGFVRGTGVFAFKVTSGDLDGGNVRFTVAHKGSAGGTLYCNSNYPLRLRALNRHTVS